MNHNSSNLALVAQIAVSQSNHGLEFVGMFVHVCFYVYVGIDIPNALRVQQLTQFVRTRKIPFIKVYLTGPNGIWSTKTVRCMEGFVLSRPVVSRFTCIRQANQPKVPDE